MIRVAHLISWYTPLLGLKFNMQKVLRAIKVTQVFKAFPAHKDPQVDLPAHKGYRDPKGCKDRRVYLGWLGALTILF